jgi:hypothetical protein
MIEDGVDASVFVLAENGCLKALFARLVVEACMRGISVTARASNGTLELASGGRIELLSNRSHRGDRPVFDSLRVRLQRKADARTATVYAQDREGAWAVFPLDVWIARGVVIPAPTRLQRVANDCS